jgi:hypothetical protein
MASNPSKVRVVIFVGHTIARRLMDVPFSLSRRALAVGSLSRPFDLIASKILDHARLSSAPGRASVDHTPAQRAAQARLADDRSSRTLSRFILFDLASVVLAPRISLPDLLAIQKLSSNKCLWDFAGSALMSVSTSSQCPRFWRIRETT